MEPVIYNHPIVLSMIYYVICLSIIQWYVAIPLQETKKRREQMRQHCKKLYDAYYN